MTNLERNQIFSWLIGDLQGDNLGPFLLRIVFILAVIPEYRIYLLFLSICRTKYISTSAFENGCLLVSQRRLVMSNFNGHLLFQADRLSCSYLNPPGGTNFTLPVLILSLSGRRSNHSYGRFIH